jgi:N-acyl-D-amino-acid deacylase
MSSGRRGSGKTAIRGGRVVDGCGNPWVRADVLIDDGVIAEIAPPGRLRLPAGDSDLRVIDVDDRYVTPGFIDPHTHSDVTILGTPDAEGILRMGVTTHVTGNCGMSPAPLSESRRDDVIHQLEYYWNVDDLKWGWTSFKEYVDALAASGIGINIAPLIGHGTLRVAAMGFERREPAASEMNVMKELLAQSLADGALGLSTGLVYPPGCYADTAELLELARVVAKYGGIYTSHVRGERETLLDAIGEALRIAEMAELPVEVSHNAPKWGGPPASRSLEKIEMARRRGIDATVDNDTHTDLAPRLSRALPQPVANLARDEMMALLADPARRLSLKRQIAADELPAPGYAGLLRHARFDRIVILAASDARMIGRSVEDIARQRSADPLETYLDLIVEDDDRIVAIFDYIDGDDVVQVLTHPLAMISSDGFAAALPAADAESPDYWPCCYGEYARVLECFVKERGVLHLEEAVRKMTSFPAQRFGLWDRGALRPGMRADVAVFDLDAIHDRATNEYPHEYPFKNLPARYAEGMDYVFVNGELAIDAGKTTGRLGGRVLLRPQNGRD